MRWVIAGICLLTCFAVHLMVTRDAPPLRTQNPLSKLVRDASDAELQPARVEAQLHAGSYTYVELRSDDEAEHYWAVTMGRAPPPGSHVRVRSFGHHSDFYSPRLQRRFPKLVFGIVSRID